MSAIGDEQLERIADELRTANLIAAQRYVQAGGRLPLNLRKRLDMVEDVEDVEPSRIPVAPE